MQWSKIPDIQPRQTSEFTKRLWKTCQPIVMQLGQRKYRSIVILTKCHETRSLRGQENTGHPIVRQLGQRKENKE